MIIDEVAVIQLTPWHRLLCGILVTWIVEKF